MLDIQLIPLVQAVGYPGLAAIIFAESGVFFGFFLPGASLLLTAGLLASNGFFNIWMLTPLMIAAAIAGDSVGYWFGAKIGIKLFTRPDSRFFKHEHLKRAQEFYERYGARMILFARFIPIVRTFAPIVAGIAGMRYSLFLIYNVVGAFIWAGGFTLLGYILGESVPNIEKYLMFIVLGIILLTMIPVARELYLQRKKSSDSL